MPGVLSLLLNWVGVVEDTWRLMGTTLIARKKRLADFLVSKKQWVIGIDIVDALLTSGGLEHRKVVSLG
jgi:hypothetical protein